MKGSALLFDRPDQAVPPARWMAWGWTLLLLVLLTFFCAVALGGSTALTAGGWAAVWKFRGVFLSGWLLTLFISVVSLLLSLLIGAVTVLIRRSHVLPLRSAAFLYVELVRGIPFLVLILFLYYVVFDRLGLTDRLAAGVLILSLFSGAYLSEIIRAGVESIPSLQLEAARAIGLSPWQTWRFVILPQALRRILPPLAGQLASLIKDSSLLSIIGIGEFTLAAQQVNSATYRTLESYLPLTLGYLLLTLPVTLLSKTLERRLSHED